MTLPYDHLIQSCTTSEQRIPQFYIQQQRIYDAPLASSGSIDSGYAGEVANPFDKHIQWEDVRSMGFPPSSVAQDQAMPEYNSNLDPWGSYYHTGDGSFGSYPGLIGNFQPSFNIMEIEQPQRPVSSPPQVLKEEEEDSIGVKSEDEDSTGSHSPRESHVESCPQQRQPFWAEQQLDARTRRTTRGSGDATQIHEQSITKQTSLCARTRKRIPHTAVEKRYRENLNQNLEKLRRAVPNLHAAQRRKSSDHSDALKPSKCEVLIGAVSYIKHLESENDCLKKKTLRSNVCR